MNINEKRSPTQVLTGKTLCFVVGHRYNVLVTIEAKTIALVFGQVRDQGPKLHSSIVTC